MTLFIQYGPNLNRPSYIESPGLDKKIIFSEISDNLPKLVQCSDSSNLVGISPVEIDSNKKKFLLAVSDGIYHCLTQTFVAIAREIETHGESLLVVLGVRDLDSRHTGAHAAYNFIKTYINFYKAEYLEVDIDKHYIVANNFYLLDNNEVGINKYKSLQNNAMKYIKDANPIEVVSDVKRKVYLSRSNDVVKEYRFLDDDGTVTETVKDIRITEEHILEKFLEINEFMVVDVNSFYDYADQIKFFSEVDILIASSGTGLFNSIYMPPDSLVVELFSPLFAHREDNLLYEEIHSMFYDANMSMGRSYLAVHSDKSSANIIKNLKKILNIFNE